MGYRAGVGRCKGGCHKRLSGFAVRSNMAPDRDRFSDRKPQAKTGYKWRERFFRQGLEGMEEESRRPLSSPKQLSEVVVCEMVKLKLGHRYWARARSARYTNDDTVKRQARAVLSGGWSKQV
jgi:hypothetical protein